MAWFADKLGPVPTNDITEAQANRIIAQRAEKERAANAEAAAQRQVLQAKADQSAANLRQAVQQRGQAQPAARPQQAAAPPPPAPAPPPEKKKKGWF